MMGIFDGLWNENADNEQIRKSENLIKFKSSESNSSFKLTDIVGFVYGGYSSRFWVLRKHINFMDKSEYKNLPFYAWQCISLQTKHRTIDLVIKDEKQMNIFLQYMIWSLKTVDGKSGSA